MRLILAFLAVALLWSAPALAQNVTCATRPLTDNSNACASTAWVNTFVPSGIGPLYGLGIGTNLIASGGNLNVVSGPTFQSELISGANSATISLNKVSPGAFVNQLAGFSNSLSRWALQLGDSSAESGSDAGSNLIIARYNDAGGIIDVPFGITRSSGLTTIVDGLQITDTLPATSFAIGTPLDVRVSADVSTPGVGAFTFYNNTTGSVTGGNGNRVGSNSTVFCCSSFAPGASDGFVVGGQFNGISSTPVANLKLFGLNSVAQVSGGSTPPSQVISYEADVATTLAPSVKAGIQIVQLSSDVASGTGTDAGIYFINQAGAPKWTNGIRFANNSVKTTGNLIQAANTSTSYGLDFSSATFGSGFWGAFPNNTGFQHLNHLGTLVNAMFFNSSDNILFNNSAIIIAGGAMGVTSLPSAPAGNTMCYSTTALGGYDTIGLCSSDERMKTDIVALQPADALQAISQIHPSKFRVPGEAREMYGFIAQDVMKVIPNAVYTFRNNDMYSIDTSAILAENTLAIQALLARIERLEKRRHR